MTRVRVGKHLMLNLRRRSLCDSCIADVCVRGKTERIFECDDYRAPFLVFKRCSYCGDLYEVHHNIRALDPDLCPQCNVLMANC